MAVTSKAQLTLDIAASTAAADVQLVLQDMVDSYEDIFASLTTVQRDLLTPIAGLIIYNTDNTRYEYWNGTTWFGIGQNLSSPLTIKIDLSAANLQTLFSVPFTLIPAQGVGYSILPQTYAYRYTYGTAPYDFNTSIDIFFDTLGFSGSIGSMVKESFESSSSSGCNTFNGGGGTVNALIDNKALVLQAYNNDPTTGDGTLTIWITYSIIVF